MSCPGAGRPVVDATLNPTLQDARSGGLGGSLFGHVPHYAVLPLQQWHCLLQEGRGVSRDIVGWNVLTCWVLILVVEMNRESQRAV